MPVIVFKNGYEPEFAEFWDASYQRLHREPRSAVDLGRGFIGMRLAKKKGLYIMDVEPSIPPIWPFPLFIALGMFLFGVRAVVPLGIPVLIGLSLFSFWTRHPYLLAFKLGFYKQYKHFPELTIVKRDEALRVMVWGR